MKSLTVQNSKDKTRAGTGALKALMRPRIYSGVSCESRTRQKGMI